MKKKEKIYLYNRPFRYQGVNLFHLICMALL